MLLRRSPEVPHRSQGSDFRTAEDLWEEATASTLTSIEASNGTGEVWRE